MRNNGLQRPAGDCAASDIFLRFVDGFTQQNAWSFRLISSSKPESNQVNEIQLSWPNDKQCFLTKIVSGSILFSLFESASMHSEGMRPANWFVVAHHAQLATE